MKQNPYVRKVLKLAPALILTTTCMMTTSLVAQEKQLQVVSEDSRADLYLGSRNDPKSYSAGTARVSGNVILDPNKAENTVFNLTMYSANRTSDDPAGTRMTSTRPQPAIGFHSQHATVRRDGGLEVAGQLTVTFVSRSLVVNTGESYSGPKYGPPIVSTASHEAVLTFSPVKTDLVSSETESTYLLEARETPRTSAMILTATSTVNGESFPELPNSIANTTWPVLVNDQKCTAPPSVGEDYSGPVCTGTIVNSIAPATEPIQSGEDYSGIRSVYPTGNQVTIQLVLALADDINAGSVVNSSTSDPEVRRPNVAGGGCRR